MKDSIGCRFFGLHEYENMFENKKYIVKQCKICKNYIVTYKHYNIKNKFKQDELPTNIISKIKYKCQA